MRTFGFLASAIVLVWVTVASVADADVVTFTGTVDYQGPYSGDTLYVAVLDTTTEQVPILAIKAYSVGSPPLSQSFSLDFDNALAPSDVVVAALLDVDGGGADSVSAADVIGWYAGTAVPTGVSSAQSQSGLDFDLPRAEIHGTITLAPGQTNTQILITENQQCVPEGFGHPPLDISASGDYAIVGVYAGTWCVSAYGFIPPFTFAWVCYGDATCQNPTPVPLTATQVQTGVDLDFSGYVPAQRSTWGSLKARY